MRYFVVDGTEKKGPYEVAELRELAEQGQLVTEDLLETEDAQGRIRAGLVVGVFGPAQPESIPAPTLPETTEQEVRDRRRFLWWAMGILVLAPILVFGLMAYSLATIQKKMLQDRAESVAAMKNLVRATFQYAADHDDRLPPLGESGYKIALQDYMKGTPVGNKNPGSPSWEANDALSFEKLGRIEARSDTLLYYDSLGWRDGKSVVAMADGSVSVVSQVQLGKMITAAESQKKGAAKSGPNAEAPQPSLAP